MGFIGTLVVWQGSGELRGLHVAEGATYTFEVRGPWTVSFLDAELVGDAAEPLLADTCGTTGAPVLSAFIFESDCAFVSAATPRGGFWSTCLVREFVASLDEIDETEMLHRFGSPADGVGRGVSWAKEAGLAPDEAALHAALAYTGLEEDDVIFPGIRLFDRLLDALGLPPNETPTFFDE